MHTHSISPVFILGVPRSGTTLLRVLLDSHPEVAAAPETPWILGAYGPKCSYAAFVAALTDHYTGPVENLPGCTAETVETAARRFLDEILDPYLVHRSARVLVLKTPDDISRIDVLLRRFPDSRLLHIHRDGRDVALSTATASLIGNSLRGFGRRSFESAIERWAVWEGEALDAFAAMQPSQCLSLSYEELVLKPEATLNRVCRFLGIVFDPAMLDYSQVDHEYPNWEAGSTDVKRHGAIVDVSVGRWRTALTLAERADVAERYGNTLARLGYERGGVYVGNNALDIPVRVRVVGLRMRRRTRFALQEAWRRSVGAIRALVRGGAADARPAKGRREDALVRSETNR